MASNGNQNDSKTNVSAGQTVKKRNVSSNGEESLKSLQDIFTALSSNDTGSPRPPLPQIPRSEAELDSRPPIAVGPESSIDDPFNPQSDPFASEPLDGDAELQFDFDDGLMSEDPAYDPMSIPPRPQPNVESEDFGDGWTDADVSVDSASELDDDRFDQIFKTSLGTPISVEPKPIQVADELDRLSDEPSLTPSGRPMSLQPHEELNFEFRDGRASEEEINLGQLNLGEFLDDDESLDADESVDRIIEDNRKRWSKPPKESPGVERGPDFKSDNLSGALRSDAPTNFPPVDHEERTPEFSTFPPAAPPPEVNTGQSLSPADSIDDEVPIMLPEELNSIQAEGLSFDEEVDFLTPDALEEQMHAAASGIPGASVIHIPTDAPTSAPPVQDDELDALSNEDDLDGAGKPDLDQSDDLLRALEDELASLSAPPMPQHEEEFDELEEMEEAIFNHLDHDESQEEAPTDGYPCRGACFRGVCFRGACFRGACFRGACFRGACFRGACFRGACFRGACFRGACFRGACFRGACFRGACRSRILSR